MAVEDYMEPEVAVAVAVTAAVSSPRARRVMRQGAVYGLAGVLKLGDALGVFAQGVGRGVQEAAAATEGEQDGEGSEPSLATRRAGRARGGRGTADTKQVDEKA